MTSLDLVEVTPTVAYAPRPGLTVLMGEDCGWFVAGRMRVRVDAARESTLWSVLHEFAAGEALAAAQIAERSGLDETTVEGILADLRRRGLILPGQAGSQDDAHHAYFSITASASRRFGTPEAISNRLGSATVRVIGGEDFSRQVRADLVALGVDCQPSADWTVLSTGLTDEQELVDDRVLILEVDDPVACAPVIDSAVRQGFLVLPVRLTDRVEVGPFVRAGARPCADCLVLAWNDHKTDERVTGAGPSARSLAAGLVVSEVLAYLTDCQTALSEQAILTLDLDDLVTAQQMPLSDDHCARCGPGCELDTASRTIWAYENRSAGAISSIFTSRLLSNVRLEELSDLATDRSRLWTAPRIELPDADGAVAPGENGAGKALKGEGGASLVARLLQMSVGRRSDAQAQEIGRWAPTGGGMGSVGAYLLLDQEMYGLPRGSLVSYDDQAHVLEVARQSPVPQGWSDALVRSSGSSSGNRLGWMFLWSGTERLRKKYADFSVRVGLLDGGVALMQLHLVARSTGCAVEVLSTAPQGTREVLGLSDGEYILQVVALHEKEFTC